MIAETRALVRRRIWQVRPIYKPDLHQRRIGTCATAVRTLEDHLLRLSPYLLDRDPLLPGDPTFDGYGVRAVRRSQPLRFRENVVDRHPGLRGQ